jgi:hypothetical protein
VVKWCRLSILTAREEQYNAKTAEICLGATVLFLEIGCNSRYLSIVRQRRFARGLYAITFRSIVYCPWMAGSA